MRIFWRCVQVLVTAGLIVLIVSVVNWGKTWDVLRRSDLVLYGLSVVLWFGQVALATRRTQEVATCWTDRPPFWPFFQYYLVGTTANQFLPSTIGGDVVRVTAMKKWLGSLSVSASVVVMERGVGYITTMLIPLVPLALANRGFRESRVLRDTAWFVALAGACLLALGLSSSVWLRLLPRFEARNRFGWFLSKIQHLLGLCSEAFRRWRPLSGAFVYSVLRALFGGFLMKLVLFAVGQDIPYWTAVGVLCLVEVISVIPISIGGLGLSEGAQILLLGEAGMSREIATAYAILTRASGPLFSLVSLPFALSAFREIWRDMRKKREEAAEAIRAQEPKTPPDGGK